MYRKGAPIIGWSPRFIPALAMFHFALSAVRVCDWVIYRTRILGRQHLRSLPAAVVVSNHTLLFDPGIVAHAIRPRRTYFTMLEQTALIPYLGTFVRLLGAVPIPEGPGSLRILDDAARAAFGTFGLIHFFPEGELSLHNQELQPFHPGAFLLACRRGVPVVTVTTVLHQRLWRGRPWVRIAGHTLRLPPRLSIVIGPPRYPDEQDRRSPVRAARVMADRVRQEMQAAIDRHGGCKTMGRGLMPRLGKRPEKQSA